MRRMRRAFERITDASSAEKIAFHLAELKPELSQLADLLTRVERTGRVAVTAFRRMTYFLLAHWPYHIKALMRLLDSPSLAQYDESVSERAQVAKKKRG